MAPPLLTLQDIHLGFGGAALLEAAELVVSPADRLCLVGRNGSGKSTLLKIAAGIQEPDRGSRFIQPGVTLRYLPQEPDFTCCATVMPVARAVTWKSFPSTTPKCTRNLVCAWARWADW